MEIKTSDKIDKHLFEKGRMAIATNRNQKHEVKSFHNASQIPLPFHFFFKDVFPKFCQRHMRGKSRSTWPGMAKEFFSARNHAFWVKALESRETYENLWESGKRDLASFIH